MNKKFENRFVDVFDNQAEDVNAKDLTNKVKKLDIKKHISKSEYNFDYNMALINGITLRGEYKYNERTRGSKTKNKCSVCNAEIEKIYCKKFNEITSKYIWEEEYDRCSKCYIVYGFLGVK